MLAHPLERRNQLEADTKSEYFRIKLSVLSENTMLKKELQVHGRMMCENTTESEISEEFEISFDRDLISIFFRDYCSQKKKRIFSDKMEKVALAWISSKPVPFVGTC